MILDITKQIWQTKQQRQLIFTSHNANIVVDGDAELVICCDHRVAGQQSGGQIRCEGAIDFRDVRNEITKVTEGGPQAFRLRKDIEAIIAKVLIPAECSSPSALILSVIGGVYGSNRRLIMSSPVVIDTNELKVIQTNYPGGSKKVVIDICRRIPKT